MDLIDKISGFAEKNGFFAGITGGGPIKKNPGDKKIPFVKFSVNERNEPRLTMPGCKSVIIIGLGYRKKYSFADDGLPRGILSQGAVGIDYHVLVREKLESLKNHLSGFVNFSCKIFADTGPLDEKALLVKAGMGFLGVNGLVFNKKHGSFFNAGYMMTDLDMPVKNRTVKPECGDCRLCVKTCPGGAIMENAFDYTRCVSYITQKSGLLSDSEKRIMGTNLYGCDVCQDVCPLNKHVPAAEITDIESAMPALARIINLSKPEFHERYKDTALYWRGLNILKRNARIANDNINKGGE